MKQIMINETCNGCGMCIVKCPGYFEENADGDAQVISGILADETDGELPSGRVALLAKDGDVLYHVAAMVLDEGGGLHEHASAAAAGVVHTTVERLEDFNQRAHDARRCIELAGVFALH